MSSVIADLEAARISPAEAVARLTAQALDRARCPSSLRPAVEARVRASLERDPHLAMLLRRMGAATTSDE